MIAVATSRIESEDLAPPSRFEAACRTKADNLVRLLHARHGEGDTTVTREQDHISGGVVVRVTLKIVGDQRASHGAALGMPVGVKACDVPRGRV